MRHPCRFDAVKTCPADEKYLENYKMSNYVLVKEIIPQKNVFINRI